MLNGIMQLTPWLVLVPTAAMFILGATPVGRANRKVDRMGQLLVRAAMIQGVIAVVIAAIWLLAGRPSQTVSLPASGGITLLADLGFLIDGVTVLMFGLISFIGWVIVRYSLRYLDGDAYQGRFFKQLAFTIACVTLLVWSSSLFMFTAAWFGVSLGLHSLLMHFGNRSGARRAAWLKFTISRCGELLLVASVAILLSAYGTTQFSTITSLAQDFASGASSGSLSATSLRVASWLLVVAAIIKTAQFPFHAWLPQTLETPTPVSAFMHAGVVNAGGYLMIRAGAWFVADPSPLILLTFIGTVTALYGAIVMSTQPSIKRQLAYSTVAQMGFMMLQCGLGAFSAAMLHILAHSLYKAHAFLASGNVLHDRQAADVTQAVGRSSSLWAIRELALTIPAAGAMMVSGGFVLNTVASSKAAAAPLAVFWLIGVFYYVVLALRTANLVTLGRALLTASLLANLYAFSLWVVQQCFANIPLAGYGPSPISLGIVIVGFALLIAWQLGLVHGLLRTVAKSHWISVAHIHASNGFYLESLWRRWAPLIPLVGSLNRTA